MLLAVPASSAIYMIGCGGEVMTADRDAGGSSAPIQKWDGGLVTTTQGRVRCGGTTCAVGGEYCCLAGEGTPASNGCAPRNGVWCNGSSFRRSCEKTSDCAEGEVCCLHVGGGPPPTITSSCMPVADGGACLPGDWMGCGSEDDCRALDASACVAQLCRGDVLQTCGRIWSEACAP